MSASISPQTLIEVIAAFVSEQVGLHSKHLRRQQGLWTQAFIFIPLVLRFVVGGRFCRSATRRPGAADPLLGPFVVYKTAQRSAFSPQIQLRIPRTLFENPLETPQTPNSISMDSLITLIFGAAPVVDAQNIEEVEVVSQENDPKPGGGCIVA